MAKEPDTSDIQKLLSRDWILLPTLGGEFLLTRREDIRGLHVDKAGKLHVYIGGIDPKKQDWAVHMTFKGLVQALGETMVDPTEGFNDAVEKNLKFWEKNIKE